jgi:hypothetical protein
MVSDPVKRRDYDRGGFGGTGQRYSGNDYYSRFYRYQRTYCHPPCDESFRVLFLVGLLLLVRTANAM